MTNLHLASYRVRRDVGEFGEAMLLSAAPPLRPFQHPALDDLKALESWDVSDDWVELTPAECLVKPF